MDLAKYGCDVSYINMVFLTLWLKLLMILFVDQEPT